MVNEWETAVHRMIGDKTRVGSGFKRSSEMMCSDTKKANKKTMDRQLP